MPEGWDFNPWALSPWAAEPARNAASDTGRLGGGHVAPSLADVLTPPRPVRDADDYDPADWFAYFARRWPTVANVIPPEEQVLERDRQTVLDWVNRRLTADEQRTYVVCFHFAKYQMDRAGYDVSGPPARDSSSHLVIREYRQPRRENVSELQLLEARLAVAYLCDSLVNGVPVMVGVKLADYPYEPNNIWGTPYVIATDHFVVAVGAGVDDRGTPYVDVYDYLHSYRVPTDRLYLTPLLTLESAGTVMRVIELRRSYPRA